MLFLCGGSSAYWNSSRNYPGFLRQFTKKTQGMTLKINVLVSSLFFLHFKKKLHSEWGWGWNEDHLGVVMKPSLLLRAIEMEGESRSITTEHLSLIATPWDTVSHRAQSTSPASPQAGQSCQYLMDDQSGLSQRVSGHTAWKMVGLGFERSCSCLWSPGLPLRPRDWVLLSLSKD